MRCARFVFVWALLLIMAAGCGGKTIDPTTGETKQTPPATVGKEDGPKVLRMYYNNTPTIDPQLNAWGLWAGMDGLFEGLTRLDETFLGVKPALAQSWDISPDGKVYTFKLRPNAKWSNGDPLTAHDFVFAYRRLIDPATKAFVAWGPTYLENFQDIKDGKKPFDALGAKALDDTTLQLTLQHPASDFLITMALPTAFPVPKKVIEEHGAAWTDLKNFANNGPWKVAVYELNTKMELVPNPEYGGDKPQLDRLILLFNQAQLISYENDEVDIMSVTLADLDTVRNDPKLSKQLIELPIKNYVHMTMSPNQNPAGENVKFRQAIAHAIDKERIAKTVMKETATAAWVTLPEGVPGHDLSAGRMFDVTRARQLLADAGFPNGNGAPPIHILVAGANPAPHILAIKDDLEKNLGLTVNIDAMEGGVYAAKRFDLHPPDRVVYWVNSNQVSYASPRVVHVYAARDGAKANSLPLDLKVRNWHAGREADAEKDAAAKAKIIAEIARIRDENASQEALRIFDLYEKAYRGASAEEEIAIFKQIQLHDREQSFQIPLFWNKSYFLVKPQVQGHRPNPFMGGRFYWSLVTMDPSKK